MPEPTDKTVEGGGRIRINRVVPGDTRPVWVPLESATAEDAERDMETLRHLLVGPTQAEIRAVDQKIEHLGKYPLGPEAVAYVLPEAIVQRLGEDAQLTHALSPAIEETLRVSIQTNPKPMADAIFPIIGPAIRKSISEALRGLFESVNRSVENSLSVQSIRWRIEAARSGKSFGEVVLSHTLVYRVEQLFLIDRDTGLPIRHVTAEAVEAQDGALVSGMLTAIQDFVQSSFGAGEDEVLDAMQMGDLTVWIEEGPKALVAAVIRGIPEPGLRTTLRELIESFHLRYARHLDTFDGDTTPFESAEELLQLGLQAQFSEAAQAKSRRRQYAMMAAIGVLLVGWLAFSIWDNLRWNRYLSLLEAEPGIVITEEGRKRGLWHVQGLRDPLAVHPDSVLNETSLRPANVRSDWEPYQALVPELIVSRATMLLQPPEAVQFALDGNTLVASGEASVAWLAQLRQQARFVPGVYDLNTTALNLEEAAALRALAQQLEQEALIFRAGSTQLVPASQVFLDELVAQVLEVQALKSITEQDVRLRVLGYASSEGSVALNQRISTQRAELIRDRLVASGIEADLVEAIGTGEPLTGRIGVSSEERAQNRGVRIEVEISNER